MKGQRRLTEPRGREFYVRARLKSRPLRPLSSDFIQLEIAGGGTGGAYPASARPVPISLPGRGTRPFVGAVSFKSCGNESAAG